MPIWFPSIVPTRDGELAWEIGKAVMRGLTVVNVYHKTAEFHPRIVFLSVWRTYICEVKRKLVPGTCVKNLCA